MGDIYFKATRTRAGIFEEKNGGHAPFNNPVNNLDRVFFHTDLDYMEVAKEGSKSITFPKVNPSTPEDVDNYNDGIAYSQVTNTYTLLSHNLGFKPFCIVVVDGEILPAGHPIQTKTSTGSLRIVTPFVTDTQVKLREVVNVRGSALSAKSKTFEIIVFDIPVGNADLSIKPARMKVGSFDSRKRYLRVANASETRYFLSLGRTVDLDNATARIVTPAGSVIEDRPPGEYGGNFSGSGSIAVSIGADNEGSGKSEVRLNTGNGLKVWDNGNLVWSTNRKLVNLFERLDINNKNFNFPNPPTDFIYYENRQSEMKIIVPGQDPVTVYGINSITYASVEPEEWSKTINLATLDSDQGDFLLVLARAKQTTAPAKIGNKNALRPVHKSLVENQWVVVTGSMILEMDFFLRRALSFDIEGNKLVARLEQSTGGFNTGKTKESQYNAIGVTNYDTFDRSATHKEMPVRYIDDKQSPTVEDTDGLLNWKEGGSNASKTSFSWKWNSVWQFDLKFAVGRMN